MGDLKRHIKNVHEGLKNHVCDSCGKAFSEAGNLRKHIKGVHQGQKNHKCEYCEKSFFEYSNLKTHIKGVHKGQKINHEKKSTNLHIPTADRGNEPRHHWPIM